jgi:hypothetical protein
VIFFYLFSSALLIVSNFLFICFPSSFVAILCSINRVYCLIRISEGLLYV